MNILLSFDGSAASVNALKLAQEHVKIFKASLLIVKVLMQDPELDYEKIRQVEQQLEIDVGKLMTKSGINWKILVLVSKTSAGDEVVRYAQKNGIDEIIIGIQKMSKVGKVLFGSNAQHIILHAHCPVVSV